MAKAKTQAPLTTAQQLGSLIKTARDIMRKDKGLSSDLGRLPMLTWIMFLKFLDDMEQIEESRAELRGEKYRPSIEKPYRWRDWAAKEDGITGPELLAFINQEEAVLPNGKKGPGLFTYLRGLRSANGNGGRRQVIATVFSGVSNNMISGYLLRDVMNKVNGIHFLAKEEMFTLGHLYESMLKEMRDAAGQNGEFYTPRAVVRFMVEVLDPRLGETLLDPACGTGGFLVEAYSHLEKQCKTVQDRKMLQERTIFGGEAKPLPYLLCQMNLLLHGLEAPKIDPENSLRFPLAQIGDRDRVDVIMTNPPFGGEEERGILSNFPEDKQTAETALLFLQLIMRKLRRQPKPGRAGVIVPTGVLFGEGICARVKENLLKEFNLHTIVRLPNGVFSPYTPIPTNLLFFDRSGPTNDVWYYELPLPEGKKSYSKTLPLQFDELAGCLNWWKNRRESERAWKVSAKHLLERGCNLDVANPSLAEDLQDKPIADILAKEQQIVGIVRELHRLFAEANSVVGRADARLETGKCLRQVAAILADQLVEAEEFRIWPPELLADAPTLEEVTTFLARGRQTKQGHSDHYLIKTQHVQMGRYVDSVLTLSPDAAAKVDQDAMARPGDTLIACSAAGCLGRVAFFSDGVRRASTDSHVAIARPNPDILTPEYLYAYLRSAQGQLQLRSREKGDWKREKVGFRLTELNVADLRKVPVPVPPLEDQRRIFAYVEAIRTKCEAMKQLRERSAAELDKLLPAVLDHAVQGKP